MPSKYRNSKGDGEMKEGKKTREEESEKLAPGKLTETWRIKAAALDLYSLK